MAKRKWSSDYNRTQGTFAKRNGWHDYPWTSFLWLESTNFTSVGFRYNKIQYNAIHCHNLSAKWTMEKSSTANIAYAIGFERMNFFVHRFVCSDISITSLVSFIVSIFKHVIIHMIFVRIRPDEMIWNSARSFLFYSFRHPLP